MGIDRCVLKHQSRGYFEGENRQLTHSVVEGSGSKFLAADGTAGVTAADIDRGDCSASDGRAYTITLRATGNGDPLLTPNASDFILPVSLSGSNDHAPMVDADGAYKATVNETASVGTDVPALNAPGTDATAPFNTVRYSGMAWSINTGGVSALGTIGTPPTAATTTPTTAPTITTTTPPPTTTTTTNLEH